VHIEKTKAGFSNTDQQVSSRLLHNTVSNHTIPSQINHNTLTLFTNGLQHQLGDIKQLLDNMGQQFNKYLSTGTTYSNTNNEPPLTATSFDTWLHQETLPCMHPTTASLYDISKLLPVSYTQMLPEILTAGQNSQLHMVYTTNHTRVHTPTMTYHTTSPSNLPHPMASATNYCSHTFLWSYLHHTFLHSKDLLKPA